MNEFIETTEKIHAIGGTCMIYVGEEAKQLGLKSEETIGAVLFRPEELNNVKSMLYGADVYLFFVSVGFNDGVFFEIRKAVSERILSGSLYYEPIAILGPFDTLAECRRFRNNLETNPETDSGRLKDRFRTFVGDE